MSELEATGNLNAMNQTPTPWRLSFSFGRALQNSVLKAWQGKAENVTKAQETFFKRARLNSLAQLGKYSPALEDDQSAAEGMYVKDYKY